MSAGWHEWGAFGPTPLPLFELKVPSVHMWGHSASPNTGMLALCVADRSALLACGELGQRTKCRLGESVRDV